MMDSGRGRSASAASRSASRPLRSPSMIRRLQPLVQRQRGQLLGPRRPGRGRVDALEQLDEPLQRVVALAPPVVDQVQGDLALLVGDLRHRQDLAGVHDRRGQPGLHALVQEHRVEHLPGGRVEPEGDVGDAQGEVDPGIAARRSPGSPRSSRCRRGGSPPARWRSGRSAQSMRMSGRRQPPAAGQVVDQPGRDPDLPLRGTRLALLVDESAPPRRRRARATIGITRA